MVSSIRILVRLSILNVFVSFFAESEFVPKWLSMMAEICDIYTAYNNDVPVVQLSRT